MYSYDNFTELRGPRIHLKRLIEKDIHEISENFYSPTTWVVAKRGIDTKEKITKYLQGHIEKDGKGEGLTLVARLNGTNEAVAISRYHCAGPGFLRVEIGFTWVADKWTRTFVNTEKKLLMIQYAFDVMGVKRVEFSVDPRNEKSNTAMKRIGATFEGTLRKWRYLNDRDEGHRNIYSIIDEEWPAVKNNFEKCLMQNQASEKRPLRQ